MTNGGVNHARALKRVLVIGNTGESRLLASALSELGFYTSLVFGLEGGVERVTSEHPDAAVTELADEGRLAQLRHLDEWTRVIVLLSRGQQPLWTTDAFWWPDDPTAVAARIGSLLESRGPRPLVEAAADLSAAITIDELMIDPRSTQAFVNGHDVGLTASEFRLLHAIALAEGAPLSRSELSRRAGVAASRAVDQLIRRVRVKLTTAGASRRYIETRVHHGYYLATEPSSLGDQDRLNAGPRSP